MPVQLQYVLERYHVPLRIDQQCFLQWPSGTARICSDEFVLLQCSDGWELYYSSQFNCHMFTILFQYHTRIGIITYSDTVQLRYSLGSLDYNQLQSLNQIGYMGGYGTNLDL